MAFDEYLRLRQAEGESYARVAEGRPQKNVEVSTCWLGLDQSLGKSPKPLIFETVVFGGKNDGFCCRYDNEEDAHDGHRVIMAAIKSGKDAGDAVREWRA